MKKLLFWVLLGIWASGLTGCQKEPEASDTDTKPEPSGTSISNLIDQTAGQGEKTLSDLSEKVDSTVKEVEGKVTTEIEKAVESTVEHMEAFGQTLRSIKDKASAETVSDKIIEIIGKMQASGEMINQLDEETQRQMMLPYMERLQAVTKTIQQELQRLAGMPDVMMVLSEAFQKLGNLPTITSGSE